MRRLWWSSLSKRRCSASPLRFFQRIPQLKVLRAAHYTNHVVRPKHSGFFAFWNNYRCLPPSLQILVLHAEAARVRSRVDRAFLFTDKIVQNNASLHHVLHILHLVQPGRLVQDLEALIQHTECNHLGTPSFCPAKNVSMSPGGIPMVESR